MIEGIHFVTNLNNERIAVQIDLKKHGQLWEDFYDLLIIKARESEERVSWKEIKADLQNLT